MTIMEASGTVGRARNKITPIRVDLMGVEVAFEPAQGTVQLGGVPGVMMWLETTVAGLMLGLSRMVGTERFNLALQSGGRDSVEADWEHISSFPTFTEGFASLATIAAAAGWGRWDLVLLDDDAKEARFRCRNGWEMQYQRALGVCWGSSMVGGKFAGFASRRFGCNCWAQQVSFQARGDDCDEFLVRPSDRTVESEIERLLESDTATRADLAVALQTLRREVEERRAAEEALRRSEKEKLTLIEAQKRAIVALSTPIIQIWDGVVTLPIVGALDSGRAESIMHTLLSDIVSRAARFAILDVTGVNGLDAETADHLLRIVRAAELLGARVIVSGIRPAVAQTIVELGVDLASLQTVADLQEALKLCFRSLGVQALPAVKPAAPRLSREIAVSAGWRPGAR
jgi:rsbT co-antagonist protein RsbR